MGSLRSLVCNPKSIVNRRETTNPVIYNLRDYCESWRSFLSGKFLMRTNLYSEIETHCLNLEVTLISLIGDAPEEDDRTLLGYSIHKGLICAVNEHNESDPEHVVTLDWHPEVKGGLFIKFVHISGV